MNKNSQPEKSVNSKDKDFSFKLQTLINELLPVLLLLELPQNNIQEPIREDAYYTDRPMAAFQFKKRIKSDYVALVEGDEKAKDFDIRPGLLYGLLNDLDQSGFLKKDENEYLISGKGLLLLLEEIKRFDKFIECYQNKRERISKLIESLKNEE